jgi:hypothetical protein
MGESERDIADGARRVVVDADRFAADGTGHRARLGLDEGSADDLDGALGCAAGPQRGEALAFADDLGIATALGSALGARSSGEAHRAIAVMG